MGINFEKMVKKGTKKETVITQAQTKKEETKNKKKMSIDSKEEKSEEIIEDNESSMEVEEEESEEMNNNGVRNSRVAKATKDMEKMETIENNNTGVIYIGHLPWGFDEKGVKKYFEQFGNITRIMLPRSSKSGRVKGYGFVEFDAMEIAEVAAKTMNNYILFDRMLICNVVSDTSKYNLLFKKCKNVFKFHNKYNAYIFERNKPKSKHELKDYVNTLLEKENKKREKLKEMKLDFDFPGFGALLNLNEKKSNVKSAKETKSKEKVKESIEVVAKGKGSKAKTTKKK